MQKKNYDKIYRNTFFLSLMISYLGKNGKNTLVTLSLALYRAWSSGRKGAKIEHFSRYFALKKKVNYNYTMNIYFELSYCQKILGRSYEKKKKDPQSHLSFRLEIQDYSAAWYFWRFRIFDVFNCNLSVTLNIVKRKILFYVNCKY